MIRSRLAATIIAALLWVLPTSAYTIQLDHTSFALAPVFNQVTSFSITIEVAAPLAPGVYTNPALTSVDYFVNGVIAPVTPSGFNSPFALVRNMTGAEFYAQGSSLQFEIAPGANLTDGLQLSDLTGADPVFVFNAREVGLTPGRYHPPLFELNADGTGRIQNSNNMGGLNPSSNMLVNVDFGEEYIVDLTFSPSALTLSSDTATVPEPGAGLTFGAALLLAGVWSRRRCGQR